MDPSLRGFSGPGNGIQLTNQQVSVFPNQNLVAGRLEDFFVGSSFTDYPYLQPDPAPSNVVSSLSVNREEDSPEDCDFSDAVLRYINQMLMEEDIEEKNCMLQESLDLQAAEKSFYDVLGKKYPPSPEHNLTFFDQNGECPDGDSSKNSESYLLDPPQSHPFYINGGNDVSNLQLPGWNNESQPTWQFRKGIEEANGEANEVVVKVEKEEVGDFPLNNGSRGRKNPYRECVDLEEESSSKQAAVFLESPLRTKMFDMVLLCLGGNSPTVALREALKNASSKIAKRNLQSKGSNLGKGRGRKQSGKIEVVDLRTLLIHCARAVAADDRGSAHELLQQIRQHSSPFGDGNQRLARCFADGLEARLAGTGSLIYKGLINKRTSAADILKAYQLYLAACPFRKLSNFTANKTIMSLAKNSMRLHIIDFGILYGFQWPTLIQRISMRLGGPPKLRITGIEFPQSGFRPAERVEETGRRLADYAKEFNVPFEYNAIAKKWDTIQLEELKIERDEVLVVNCLYRAKNLHDETIAVDSSRNIFLNFVRKINPDMFIHGITNGAYNAPFFVTRFREVLFHFSAMFDMLETIVPREDRERMVIEKEIFGREALNVIACEGWERVERPETYKQWQVRNLRAGFVQLPLDQDIVKIATERVRSGYHKDFVIDEDNRWLLQGWKGRIIYALSTWKPA